MSIISPSGVAKTIVVRRSGFASWLDIDGVFIGLNPHSNVSVDIDPDELPCVTLRLYADRVYVDNSLHTAGDDRGYGDGQTEGEAQTEATGECVRLSEGEEVSDS